MKYNRGVSFFEFIIVVAIMGIILAVSIPSFASFRNRQVVRNTAEELVSLLNDARNDTLLSKSSNYYSVHIENSRAVLFTGGTFDTNALTNRVITFDTLVTAPSLNISLNGGGVDVKFDRLTGDTSQYGTIQVSLISDSTIKKIITINKLGVVSAN